MTILSRESRMRGSALEACLKALILASRAQREAQIPTAFYFKPSDHLPGVMLENVEILQMVWPLARRVQQLLQSNGFNLKFVQSTYIYTGSVRATRSKKAVSVDLTVTRDGRRFWIEIKYTDKTT